MNDDTKGDKNGNGNQQPWTGTQDGVHNFALQQRAPPVPSVSRTTAMKKQLPKHIPRPMNAFMIFSNENRTDLRKKFPLLQNKELSKRLGAIWRKLGTEEQGVYYRKAKLASEEHRRRYPDYHYRPRGRGSAPSTSVEKSNPIPTTVCNNAPMPSRSANIQGSVELKPNFSSGMLNSFSGSTTYGVSQAATPMQHATMQQRSHSRLADQHKNGSASSTISQNANTTNFKQHDPSTLTAFANLCHHYFGAGSDLLANATTAEMLTRAPFLNGVQTPITSLASSSQHASSAVGHAIHNEDSRNRMASTWPPVQLPPHGLYNVSRLPMIMYQQIQQANAANIMNPNLAINGFCNPPISNLESLRLSNSDCREMVETANFAGSNGSFSKQPFSQPNNMACMASTSRTSEAPHLSIPQPASNEHSDYQPYLTSQQSHYPTNNFTPLPASAQDVGSKTGFNDFVSEANDEPGEQWDGSNTEHLGYESSVTPGTSSCYSYGGIGSVQQQPSVDSGVSMSDDASNDPVNMCLNTNSGMSSASWGNDVDDLRIDGGNGDSQQLYADSPLALNQGRQSAMTTNSYGQAYSTSASSFSNDMYSNNATVGSPVMPLDFVKSECVYAENFSVFTAGTSENAFPEQSVDLEDDQLLDFDFTNEADNPSFHNSNVRWDLQENLYDNANLGN